MQRKNSVTSVAFLILFLISACVIPKKDSKATQDGLAAYEQIDASKTVLLFSKFYSGMYHGLYNKRRMNDCRKFYHGKVEAVSFKDLDTDPTYQDKSIYRFKLIENSESTDWTTFSSNRISTNTHTITNFFVFDRETGNQFDLNVGGVNPDRVFKKAVKKLNKHLGHK